jgi:hypothetical protein
MAHRTTPLLPRVPVARSTDCCVTPNASHLSAEPRLCGRGGPYSLSDERTNFLRRPSEVLLSRAETNLQFVLAVRVIANNTPGANGIDPLSANARPRRIDWHCHEVALRIEF